MANNTFDGSFSTETSAAGTTWGVSSDSNDLITSVTEGVVSAKEETVDMFSGLKEGADTTVSYAVEAFTDSSQYSNVYDALESAATKYKKDLVDRIETLWSTPTTVTIGGIMEEVAPYALNTKEALKLLVRKVGNLTTYLTGITSASDDSGSWWKTLLNSGGEIGSDILSDSSVQSAMSQLSIVQSFASSVSTVVGVIDSIQSILKKVEPLIPYIEILGEFALGCEFRIGPVTKFQNITKGAQDTVSNVSKLQERITAQALYDLKRYLYSIKLTVPSLLVGSLQSLSVQEALVGYEGLGNQNTIVQAMFSDSFYTGTANSLTVAKSIEMSLNSLRAKVSSPISSIFNTSDFNSTFVANYMALIVEEARRGLKLDKPPQSLNRMTFTNDFTETNVNVEYKEGAPYAAQEISYFDKNANLPEISYRIDMEYQISDNKTKLMSPGLGWSQECPIPTRQKPYLWIRYKYMLADGISTDYSEPCMIASYKTDTRKVLDISVYFFPYLFTKSYSSVTERKEEIKEKLKDANWRNATLGEASLGNGTGHSNQVSVWAYVETTYINQGRPSEEALQNFLEGQLRPDQLLPDTIRTISYAIYEGIV